MNKKKIKELLVALCLFSAISILIILTEVNLQIENEIFTLIGVSAIAFTSIRLAKLIEKE